MLTENENQEDTMEVLIDSTELDSEFDIIEELKDTFDELSQFDGKTAAVSLREKVLYLGFLIRELEDNLSGEHEKLRYRRFIVKKTPA